MNLPHDLTHETRAAVAAAYRAHRRLRLCAWLGASLLWLLIGVALGCLAANSPGIAQTLGIAAVVVWGLWGLRFLLSRN